MHARRGSRRASCFSGWTRGCLVAALVLSASAGCSSDANRAAPSASASALAKPDDGIAAAASGRAAFALPSARPIASGKPLTLEGPRAISITLPEGFEKSDAGFQFVQAQRGDLELTLVAGEDKGALEADADLAATLATDPRAIARRFDAGSLAGVLEALPVDTDGAGKSWERLHFRAWTGIVDGKGLRIVLNLKFPAGSRAEHAQTFADVVASLAVAPAPEPDASGAVSSSPAASGAR